MHQNSPASSGSSHNESLALEECDYTDFSDAFTTEEGFFSLSLFFCFYSKLAELASLFLEEAIFPMDFSLNACSKETECGGCTFCSSCLLVKKCMLLLPPADFHGQKNRGEK